MENTCQMNFFSIPGQVQLTWNAAYVCKDFNSTLVGWNGGQAEEAEKDREGEKPTGGC